MYRLCVDELTRTATDPRTQLLERTSGGSWLPARSICHSGPPPLGGSVAQLGGQQTAAAAAGAAAAPTLPDTGRLRQLERLGRVLVHDLSDEPFRPHLQLQLPALLVLALGAPQQLRRESRYFNCGAEGALALLAPVDEVADHWRDHILKRSAKLGTEALWQQWRGELGQSQEEFLEQATRTGALGQAAPPHARPGATGAAAAEAAHAESGAGATGCLAPASSDPSDPFDAYCAEGAAACARVRKAAQRAQAWDEAAERAAEAEAGGAGGTRGAAGGDAAAHAAAAAVAAAAVAASAALAPRAPTPITASTLDALLCEACYLRCYALLAERKAAVEALRTGFAQPAESPLPALELSAHLSLFDAMELGRLWPATAPPAAAEVLERLLPNYSTEELEVALLAAAADGDGGDDAGTGDGAAAGAAADDDGAGADTSAAMASRIHRAKEQQERVFLWLQELVRALDEHELSQLLVFATAQRALPYDGAPINVDFTQCEQLAAAPAPGASPSGEGGEGGGGAAPVARVGRPRLPQASTCTLTITLSTLYTDKEQLAHHLREAVQQPGFQLA
jgi:hypothetical protein